MSGWIGAYETTPPWDVGHPQNAISDLQLKGQLSGELVLDVGCGTGENAIFLTEAGFDVYGIDFTPRAIEIAQVKSFERGLDIDFRVADVLELDYHFQEGMFDTVIDSGLFHTLTDDERVLYVEQVARVLKSTGEYFMLCFSVKQPGNYGPRRISRSEITETLQGTFRIEYVKDAIYESNLHQDGAKAYLVSAKKLDSNGSPMQKEA